MKAMSRGNQAKGAGKDKSRTQSDDTDRLFLTRQEWHRKHPSQRGREGRNNCSWEDVKTGRRMKSGKEKRKRKRKRRKTTYWKHCQRLFKIKIHYINCLCLVVQSKNINNQDKQE